jgi:hypothetical protein
VNFLLWFKTRQATVTNKVDPIKIWIHENSITHSNAGDEKEIRDIPHPE